jgi:hypothetical protein
VALHKDKVLTVTLNHNQFRKTVTAFNPCGYGPNFVGGILFNINPVNILGAVDDTAGPSTQSDPRLAVGVLKPAEFNDFKCRPTPLNIAGEALEQEAIGLISPDSLQ